MTASAPAAVFDRAISLVVPIRDETSSLRALLASISTQSRPPDEIVLVDGGSRDGTASMARALTRGDPRVTIIELPDATPGAGRNAGIAAARHEWIALTDAGIELDPTWLEALSARAARHPDIGIVFGSYDPFPGSFFERCAALAYVTPASPLYGEQTRGPSIASSLLHRSVWQQVGGFPDLRAAEDRIFIEAIRASGVPIAWAPDARMWWHLQPTLRGTFRRFRTYSTHNVRAAQHRSWHRRVTRQYVAALPWVILGLRRPRWLAVPALGFSLRVLLRVVRGRGSHRWRWVLNPARIALVGLVTICVDAAMFLGWCDAVRERRR